MRTRRRLKKCLNTYDDIDVVPMADRAVLETEGSIRVRGVRRAEGVEPDEHRPTITDPIARESPRWASGVLVRQDIYKNKT